MYEAVAIGDAPVTHEDRDLMDRFGVVVVVIPEHRRIIASAQVRRRVTLLGVDEVRELCGVSKEKDGCVIPDKVPVTLVSLECDTEAARVAGAARGSGVASNC